MGSECDIASERSKYFTTEQMVKSDELLWCIITEKLEGAEPLGNLQGLREGDGLTSQNKV